MAKLGLDRRGVKIMINEESRLHKPSYLIVLQHALYEPWLSILISGQLKTWAPSTNPLILHSYAEPVNKVLHWVDQKYWTMKWNKYLGRIILLLEIMILQFFNRRPASTKRTMSDYGFEAIEVGIPDLNTQMNRKSLAVMKYASKQSVDFIVFTTTSSFLNLNNLEKCLVTLPRRNLVAGRLVEQSGELFPSGSFRVFSPDVLIKAFTNLKLYKHWLPEDLALGKLLKLSEPQFIQISSVDIDSSRGIEELTQADLDRIVHYRLKSGTFNQRNDTALMIELQKKISAWNSR